MRVISQWIIAQWASARLQLRTRSHLRAVRATFQLSPRSPKCSCPVISRWSRAFPDGTTAPLYHPTMPPPPDNGYAHQYSVHVPETAFAPDACLAVLATRQYRLGQRLSGSPQPDDAEIWRSNPAAVRLSTPPAYGISINRGVSRLLH